MQTKSNCLYRDNASPISRDYDPSVTGSPSSDSPRRDYVVPYARWIPVKISFPDSSESICIGKLLSKSPRSVDTQSVASVF